MSISNMISDAPPGRDGFTLPSFRFMTTYVSLFNVVQTRDIRFVLLPLQIGVDGGVMAAGDLIWNLFPSITGEFAVNLKV